MKRTSNIQRSTFNLQPSGPLNVERWGLSVECLPVHRPLTACNPRMRRPPLDSVGGDVRRLTIDGPKIRVSSPRLLRRLGRGPGAQFTPKRRWRSHLSVNRWFGVRPLGCSGPNRLKPGHRTVPPGPWSQRAVRRSWRPHD